MEEFVHEQQNEQVPGADSSFPAPKVSYLVKEKMWRLDHPYAYQDGEHRILIYPGFKCDLASIPRVFWWLLAPFELSVSASLIHDFLYRHRGQLPVGAISPLRTYTQRQADLLFREIMKQEGVPRWRRTLAYQAVRWFGWAKWH